MNRFNTLDITIAPGPDAPAELMIREHLYREYPEARYAQEDGETWRHADRDLTAFSRLYPTSVFGHEASGEYGEWHTVSYYRGGSSYEVDSVVPAFDSALLPKAGEATGGQELVHRCVVRYDVGTCYGEQFVYCEPGDPEDVVWAKTRKQIRSKGITWPATADETYRIVEREACPRASLTPESLEAWLRERKPSGWEGIDVDGVINDLRN